MAVILQLPWTTNLNSWELDTPSRISSQTSEFKSSAMSHQYPPPLFGASSENQLSSTPQDRQPPPILPPSHSHTLPQPSSPIVRTGSAGQRQAKMKRSMSTPNVRNQARQEQATDSARRNKLGYHRTSVACSHCRRRKIRCIAAPGGDPQNRCANCIRLKKECKYHAVDQQPQSDQRRDSEVQGTSITSSPTTDGTMPPMQPYTHLTMPLVQELTSPDMKGGGAFSRPNEYPSLSAGWIPSESAALPKADPYWRMNSQESPITPGFSPYSPNLQQWPSSNWSQAPGDHGARDELGWSSSIPPQRSMSYSHPDSFRQNSAYPSYPPPSGGQSNVRDDFNQRAPQTAQSAIYPSILPPNPNSISGTESTATSTPGEHTPHHSSSSIPPPVLFQAQTAQTWQPYPYSKAPSQPNSETFTGNWYPPAPMSQQNGPGGAIGTTYLGIFGYPNVSQ